MSPTWAVAIAASIGAGIIHLALGPAHLEELGLLGLGFYAAATLQLGWAAAALRASRRVATAGIAINVAILAAWGLSRIVGLPAGETPWTPEAIGRPDAAAALLEGVVVLALARGVHQAAPGRSAPSPFRQLAPTALAIVLIGAGTWVGLLPGGHHDASEGRHDATEVLAAEPSVGPIVKPPAGDPANVPAAVQTSRPVDAPADGQPGDAGADHHDGDAPTH